MRTILALMILLVTLPLLPGGQATADCTIGVSSGIVAENARPLLWKSRMATIAPNQVVYYEGPRYDYIGIRTVGDNNAMMGVNTAGLSTGNSLVGPAGHNGDFMTHILGNFSTVAQVRTYIFEQLEEGTLLASGCFPFLDAAGNATMFEISQSNWVIEYDTLDPDRIQQGTYGWVVRANEWHQRLDGTDNLNILGRYRTGRLNIAGLIDIDQLTAFTVMQGNDGATGYEFMRYGPGRPESTIAVSTAISSMVVEGVVRPENPRQATMWAALGQANYAIAVPTWTVVDDIPTWLANGDLATHANHLYTLGQETTVQGRVFPVEQRFFEQVAYFQQVWLTAREPRWADMPRIEWRMAEDAHSLLHCLDGGDNDNYAPTVAMNIADRTTYIRVYGHKIAIDDLSVYVPPSIYYEDTFQFNQVERDSYDHSRIWPEMIPPPDEPILFFTRLPNMEHVLGFYGYRDEPAHLAYRWPLWPSAVEYPPPQLKFVMEPLSDEYYGTYSLSTDGWNWSRLLPLERGINYIDLEEGTAGPSRYFEADAEDVDGTIVSYLWDFGDGETSNEANVWHMFPDTGMYLISLTVTDDDGVSMTDWRYINVTCPW